MGEKISTAVVFENVVVWIF